MKFNNKITTLLVSFSLSLGGLGLATPSFAGGGHHHGGSGGHHHGGGGGHHHRGRDNLLISLGVGAIVGGIAVAASSSNPHYYGNCHRVVVRRNCHTNSWGDRVCHRVRHVNRYC